jgi:hypothetical protein
MSQISSLLLQSAAELRAFSINSPEASQFYPSWLEKLAVRLEDASRTTDPKLLRMSVEAIAYSMRDSGPFASQCAPSFNAAMAAIKRLPT